MAKPSTHAHSRSNKKTNALSNQVRIIGGLFKRRQLTFIDANGLRPTPDRLRETLFNWLTGELFDAQVLDCCAGSGVLGFEALSRGAKHCTFIEASPKQSQQLSLSAQALQLSTEQAQIYTGYAEQILAQRPSDLSAFDIVFIDPPYDLNLWQPILDTLIARALITAQTLLYIEADRPIESIINLIDTTPDDKQVLINQPSSSSSSLSSPNAASSEQFVCLKSTKVGQIYAGLYQWQPASL